MNEIVSQITAIFQNLGSNGLLWLSIIFFTILFFSVWFLSRGIRLWYWKVDKQIDALKSIDRRIEELGDGLKEDLAPDTDTKGDEIPEGADTEVLTGIPEEARHCIGKSGKIYTEEELDELIKE